MELRKCCNHPFLIDGVEETFMEELDNECRDRPWELDRERTERGLVASSGKMVLIDKLLPKLKRENHKVSCSLSSLSQTFLGETLKWKLYLVFGG